jgi:hypothetical protein
MRWLGSSTRPAALIRVTLVAVACALRVGAAPTFADAASLRVTQRLRELSMSDRPDVHDRGPRAAYGVRHGSRRESKSAGGDFVTGFS